MFSPLRRIIDAALLVRPRTIRAVAARAERSNREIAKLGSRIKHLDAHIAQLASRLADASETIRTQDRRIAMLTSLHACDAEQRAAIAACDADLQCDDAAGHLRRRIASARLDEHPFPHVVIEDVLPARVYRHMVASLPPPVFFDERRTSRAQFIRIPLGVAPAYSRRVWEFVDGVLEHVLPDALSCLFADDIARVIAPLVDGGDPGPIRLKLMDRRLLLRRPGYVIAPHRDPRWGLLTALFYLPRKDDSDEYGTQLYSALGDGEPATTGEVFYLDRSRCELARDVPARANSALLFLNSDGAHGASIPADAPPDTERYVFQVRIGPDADTARRLVARMNAEARQKWGVYRGKDVATATS